MIRNREKSSSSNNTNGGKIIASVFGIVLIMIVMILITYKVKNRKKNVDLVENNQAIPYEYFLLSTEENVGVIDKKGKIILETKYVRN